MRIAILTQYFPPEMGAPQARLHELAVRLQARGHTITVITAMPNYPTGKVFQDYRRRLFCLERMNGMKIIRTAIWPSKSTRLVPRLVSFMSFVVSSLLTGTWVVGKQDVLIVESPPLFLGMSGVPMAMLTRSKLVFMVSDIWPDLLVRIGGLTNPRQIRMLEKLEGMIYRRSACVALTNPGAADQIRERFPDVSCGVISNGVDTTLFRPELRSEEIRQEFGIKPGQFAAGYCGLHGIFQGLEVVVEAAKRLRDRDDIRIVMVGEGPTKEALIAQAKADGLENIAFYPRQPKSRMPAILASMDASLIPLAADMPGTMPSKVYEALAAGVPMVVTAGCEAEQLVRKYDVGRLFAASDADALAQGVAELAADPALREKMRASSLKLAQRFDRAVIAQRTEQLLQAVFEGVPAPEVEW